MLHVPLEIYLVHYIPYAKVIPFMYKRNTYIKCPIFALILVSTTLHTADYYYPITRKCKKCQDLHYNSIKKFSH